MGNPGKSAGWWTVSVSVCAGSHGNWNKIRECYIEINVEKVQTLQGHAVGCCRYVSTLQTAQILNEIEI